MKVLYLFSGSFPYSDSGENTFLPQELDAYCKIFDKVILIPCSTKGEKEDYFNEKLEIITEYSDFISNKNKNYFLLFKSLFNRELWVELFKYRLKFLISNRHRMVAIISYNYSYYNSKDILRKILTKYDSVSSYKFIMTYWFDQTTVTISRLKIDANAFFTRAHGYDLYDFRSTLKFFPFREIAFKQLDFVFTASDDGKQYLRIKYPKYSNKIFQGSLGMYNPNVVNIRNSSNVLRILSCSFLQPVKRLNLIFEALKILDNRDKISVEWVHIGNGPLFSKMHNELNSFKGHCVKMKLLNYESQSSLFDYYRNNSFDLFLNVSESEGRAVSIMEALACGIPVLATNVGGNPEIVTEDVGYLIDVGFTADKLADKLEEIHANSFELLKKRENSFNHWNSNFNALHSYDFMIKKIFT